MVEFFQASCPNCGKSDREVTLYGNGTCSSCGAPRSMEGMEIKRNVFVCENCNSGSSDFVSFFPNGTCSNCGAPAGEVGIIGSAEKVRKVGKFALVAYANDAEEPAKKVQMMLKEQGIDFLTLADLHLTDVSVEFRSQAMEWFVSRATRVIVMVSPGVGDDEFVKNTIKQTASYERAFPVLTDLGGWEADAFHPFQQRLVYQTHPVDIDNESLIKRGIQHWFTKS